MTMGLERETTDPYTYSVEQNLRDAGCPRALVEEFFNLPRQEDQLELLSRHRKELLEKIHQNEQRIQCLDYLVYRMEKEALSPSERPRQDASQNQHRP